MQIGGGSVVVRGEGIERSGGQHGRRTLSSFDDDNKDPLMWRARQ